MLGATEDSTSCLVRILLHATTPLIFKQSAVFSAVDSYAVTMGKHSASFVQNQHSKEPKRFKMSAR